MENVASSFAAGGNSAGAAADAHPVVGVQDSHGPPSWHNAASDPIVFATLWLAVATTGLWVFTYRLWKSTQALAVDTKTSGEAQAERMERSIAHAAQAAAAMQRANQLHEETARRQLRAYLSVTKAFAYGMSPEKQPTFGVVIKNQGQTPAYRTRLFSRLNWTTDAPEDVTVDFPEPVVEIGTVSGGDERAYRSISAGSPWPPGLYQAVMSKQATLVYSGVIVYHDAFRKRRLTTFMAYLNIENVENDKADLILANRANHSN